MLVSKNFIQVLGVIFLFGVSNLCSYAIDRDMDLLDMQRELQLLELKDKRTQLKAAIREKQNEMRGDESSMRRDINLLELQVEQRKLLSQLSQFQSAPRSTVLLEVYGVDNDLTAIVGTVTSPKQTQFQKFSVKVGDILPNGYEVGSFDVNGLTLIRDGKPRRIGMHMAETPVH